MLEAHLVEKEAFRSLAVNPVLLLPTAVPKKHSKKRQTLGLVLAFVFGLDIMQQTTQ